MILLPKRDLILPMRLQPRMRGRFKLVAVNKENGHRRVLADWFPNLITNGGLDMLGNTNINWQSVCCVGSGNTPPANTDTALQTQVASTTQTVSGGSASGVQSSAPYYGWFTQEFNFPAGTATGNLSEIGVGSATNALFSRALILDGGGSPTTITVLSNEALYATYQIQQIVPTTDVVGTITIAGVNYNYTLRAANATQAYWEPIVNDFPSVVAATVSNGTIGAITGTINGTTAAGGSYANSAYTLGSYTVDSTITFGLTAGNVAGGITAMSIQFGDAFGNGHRGFFQIGFATAIPKDGSHVLTLNVSNSWARG